MDRSIKPHYKHLVEKWTKKNESYLEKLIYQHKDAFDWFVDNTKRFAITSLASLFIISAPIINKMSVSTASATKQEIQKNVFLISDLSHLLPEEVGPLSSYREKQIEELLSRTFNLKVKAELNGIRLNTTYGRIGAEQHLSRFPGDTMASHFDNEEDAKKYWSSGMAPGLGGWRYFSEGPEITEKEKDKERYYIAVQTFLAPGYHEDPRKYIYFFKHRKMLVVNPHNGKAMVVVIGDAGPAPWTRKHLGGSPEVMKYLERYDGKAVRGVLYFFIDDPNDEVPLGPIEYN
jgi:hypothetical protein